MKTPTAKDAKYGFGRLIDLARAEPVAVAKHRRRRGDGDGGVRAVEGARHACARAGWKKIGERMRRPKAGGG
jgi:hypothetical protein